jgi:uncharacterized protein YndB with AHSA1/START domain
MDVIHTEVTISSTLDKVWNYYISPDHITKWAFASDDWEAPFAENDLKVGGRFKTTMASKDGKNKFDFTGSYTRIEDSKLIEYTIDDGRKVSVKFTPEGESTKIEVDFEMEQENSKEKQQQGWQEILNNFKKHVEAS